MGYICSNKPENKMKTLCLIPEHMHIHTSSYKKIAFMLKKVKGQKTNKQTNKKPKKICLYYIVMHKLKKQRAFPGQDPCS